MEKLALTVGGEPIIPPNGVPQGGLFKHSPGPGQAMGQRIIQVAVETLLVAVVLLSLFYIMRGALFIILSKGDKQRIEQGREKIVYAIIGLIVAFVAFFIINLIGGFFGTPLFDR